MCVWLGGGRGLVPDIIVVDVTVKQSLLLDAQGAAGTFHFVFGTLSGVGNYESFVWSLKTPTMLSL